MSELLPGLPHNVALLCLVRVPRIHHTSLRAVSKTWKEVIESKDFYNVRKKLDVTDETVFLIKNFDKPPGQLHCMEIDLKTGLCVKPLFVNDTITADIFNEGYGCASVRHLVLFFGGFSFSEDGTPSRTLHVFDTLRRIWTKGADMQYPRGEFGYGVINDKLYVAGGYAGQAVGLSTIAEVYDAEADSWSCIASMPFAMHVDFFCVWRNQLLVRGMTFPEKKPYIFSYSPVKDEWKEEKWLVNLFRPYKPLVSLAMVATTKSDDSFHVGVGEEAYHGMVTENYVKVMKLDDKTLNWKCLSEYRDEADEDSCECGTDVAPRVFIFGLKDRVLVMNHLEMRMCRHSTSSLKKTW